MKPCELCTTENPYSETEADCFYNEQHLCADHCEDMFIDAIMVIVDPANQGIELGTNEDKSNGLDVVIEDYELKGFNVRYMHMGGPWEGHIAIEEAEYVKNNGGM